MSTATLTEATRKQVFAALVDEEDAGNAPPVARKSIAAKFRLTEEQVKAIADEGAKKTWPPLVDCDD